MAKQKRQRRLPFAGHSMASLRELCPKVRIEVGNRGLEGYDVVHGMLKIHVLGDVNRWRILDFIAEYKKAESEGTI